MIDVPNGSIKTMRRMGIDPRIVDICLLTHYHGDHCFDVGYLLWEQGLICKRESPLIIVGPKGLEETVKGIFYQAALSFEFWNQIVANTMLKFIEIDGPSGEVNLDGNISVRYIKVIHGEWDAYGFLLDKGEKVLGYGGDCILCDGIHKIIQESDTAVVDMAAIKPFPIHMGIEDIKELVRLYGESHKLIATHMDDEVRNNPPEGIMIPKDGEVITI